MLSDSEYRHELQADIAPFENTLLGFFFISVGMSADLHAATARPMELAATTAGLLVVKTVIAFGLSLMMRRDRPNAVRFSLALPQASEFSFVLLGAAVAVGALSADLAALATLISAASMLATPVLFALSERFPDPSSETRAGAEVRYDRAVGCARHPRRLRSHGSDRRTDIADARHRLHRLGTGPRPGRCRASFRQHGLLR